MEATKTLFDNGEVRLVQERKHGEVVYIFQSRVFGKWYTKGSEKVFINEEALEGLSKVN